MTKKDREAILEGLKKAHPEARAELDFSNPFELLVATILSAQATDVQVNKVTPALFSAAGSPEKMARMEEKEMEGYIRSIGLWRNKGKNLIAMSRILEEAYEGKVPDSLEELVKLPG